MKQFGKVCDIPLMQCTKSETGQLAEFSTVSEACENSITKDREAGIIVGLWDHPFPANLESRPELKPLFGTAWMEEDKTFLSVEEIRSVHLRATTGLSSRQGDIVPGCTEDAILFAVLIPVHYHP
jgi:hypothetical protein